MKKASSKQQREKCKGAAQATAAGHPAFCADYKKVAELVAGYPGIHLHIALGYFDQMDYKDDMAREINHIFEWKGATSSFGHLWRCLTLS